MRTALLISAILLAPPLRAQEGEPFPQNCTLPFEDIAMEHELDQECGLEGKTRDSLNSP